MGNSYDAGSVVKVYTNPVFTANGVPTDPADGHGFFSATSPDGTADVSYTIPDVNVIHVTTGSYFVKVRATVGGKWHYRWHADSLSGVECSAQGSFDVVGDSLP